MIHATDSFIKYLATELANDPPVHWVRVSLTDEQSSTFKTGALNVSILTMDQIGHVEEALVSLDVIGTDERTSWRWVERIRDVLLQSTYAPIVDYSTTPATPIAKGRLVNWERDELEFSLVGTGANLLHFNATLPIRYLR